MSKKVLKEVLNGDIFVKNSKNGAVFTIVLKDNIALAKEEDELLVI